MSAREASASPPPLGQLERVRRHELAQVQHLLSPGLRVLELGGGSGYQASLLSALGCHVRSIDVVAPSGGRRYFPVELYDGRTIPFDDDSFDVVFSSNVLEHILPLVQTLNEIRRVLRSSGRGIHVLPTPSWRFWTSAAAIPFLARRLVPELRRVILERSWRSPAALNGDLRSRVRRALTLPIASHGEYPNAIAELYYFSETRWTAVFEMHGFDVLESFGGGLFYTGYGLLPALPHVVRRGLGVVLGAATRVYVTAAKP